LAFTKFRGHLVLRKSRGIGGFFLLASLRKGLSPLSLWEHASPMAGYVRRRETPAIAEHLESLTPPWSKKQAFSLSKGEGVRRLLDSLPILAKTRPTFK
jgi:hypothetical protein